MTFYTIFLGANCVYTNIIPTKRAEQSKINEKRLGKKMRLSSWRKK